MGLGCPLRRPRRLNRLDCWAQATVILRLVPVKEPATTAHRNARLAGVNAIIALLRQIEEVQRPAPDAAAATKRAAAALGVREKLLRVCEHLHTEVEVRRLIPLSPLFDLASFQLRQSAGLTLQGHKAMRCHRGLRELYALARSVQGKYV